MTLRQLLRYDALRKEITAQEKLDASEAATMPHLGQNDRARIVYAWMNEAKLPVPRPPRLKGDQIRTLFGQGPRGD